MLGEPGLTHDTAPHKADIHRDQLPREVKSD